MTLVCASLVTRLYSTAFLTLILYDYTVVVSCKEWKSSLTIEVYGVSLDAPIFIAPQIATATIFPLFSLTHTH
jgi:hypothetical protein